MNHHLDLLYIFLGDLKFSSLSYFRQRRMAVRLSELLLRIDYSMRRSTAFPAFSCIEPYFLIAFQTS